MQIAAIAKERRKKKASIIQNALFFYQYRTIYEKKSLSYSVLF
jgi:hypothetical protein